MSTCAVGSSTRCLLGKLLRNANPSFSLRFMEESCLGHIDRIRLDYQEYRASGWKLGSSPVAGSCPRKACSETIPATDGTYGCFKKKWFPQIIHFNRVFHHKPSILGYHYFWKHPYWFPGFGGLDLIFRAKSCQPLGFFRQLATLKFHAHQKPKPSPKPSRRWAEDRRLNEKRWSLNSGQIIATSHDLTPNGGLVREIPSFQGNLGW